MKKKILSSIKYIVLLLIGVLLLYLAFRGQDINKILLGIKNANFFWIFLSLITSLIAFFSRAYRWNLLIEPLGYQPKLRNSFYSLMVGYLANLAIPRLGEISRCVSLNKSEKIPTDLLIGTVIVERTIDVISLLILTIVLALLEFNRLGNFILSKIFLPIYHKLVAAAGNYFLLSAAGILVVVFCLYIFFLKRQKTQFAFVRKFISGILTGFKTISHMKKSASFIAHTCLIWTMYFFMSYLCFFAIEPTSHLGLTEGFFSLIIGGMGMSAPVQGGLGTFHLLVSQGLTLFGVSETDGLVYATIVHTSQFLFVLLLGGFSFFALTFSQNTNQPDVEHP